MDCGPPHSHVRVGLNFKFFHNILEEIKKKYFENNGFLRF